MDNQKIENQLIFELKGRIGAGKKFFCREVSKRLGHSSINMTLSTYAHLLADTENKLVDILNCVQNVSTQSTKCDK